ncbi:MAG: vancomycin high temperature exclusion protein [Myxococcaceae bacterium]
MARPSLRRISLIGLGVAVGLGLLPSVLIDVTYAPDIVSVDNAPASPFGVVFGAGLAPGGEPSPLLAERLETALALWQAGKVERLLLTGNAGAHHDELRAMRHYLVTAGVPEHALLTDLEGASTFDSCWRARSVFGVQNALLITQRFHLPRALFLAAHAGISARGVAAGGRPHWTSLAVWREFLARPLAVLQVLTHAPPGPPQQTSALPG